MRNIAKALSFLVGFLPSLAVAQVANYPQTLPANTIVGRLGISSGPMQAIPLTRLNQLMLNGLCQTNNARPIYSTSLSEWICEPAQSANLVLAGPTSGAAAIMTPRALVGADLPLPAASSLGGAFSKAAVASNWLRSLGTDGNLTASQPAFSDISGTIAASQLPNPTASTLGGVESKVSVSHQFLNTISTSGVPGSAQPACADVSDASVYCSAARGQLPGETTTGSASAGNVGEYISSDIAVGSAVSLTTATNANLTSVSLTAGDWDVTLMPSFTGAASTTVSFCTASISLTTATPDNTLGRGNNQIYGNATVFNLVNPAQPITARRFSLASTTTVFAVVRCNFAVSTASAFGTLSARRVR